MLRRIIEIVLGIAIVVMGYLVYSSINTPLQWQKTKAARYADVKQRLLDIRTAQIAHKAAKGYYAKTYAELTLFLNTATFKRVSKRYVTIKGNVRLLQTEVPIPVADSLFGKNYNVNALPYVPFNTKRFNMDVRVNERDGTEFIEVVDPDPFDSDDPLSFGSLTEPTLRASWEREN